MKRTAIRVATIAVNIRFVQLDDGQGTSATLKIDSISISPN